MFNLGLFEQSENIKKDTASLVAELPDAPNLVI
jgi:hypothetical protein